MKMKNLPDNRRLKPAPPGCECQNDKPDSKKIVLFDWWTGRVGALDLSGQINLKATNLIRELKDTLFLFLERLFMGFHWTNFKDPV